MIGESRHPDTRLLLMQVLYFFVERYWLNLSDEVRVDLRTRLQQWLLDPELDIQQWTFLSLSAILQHDLHHQEKQNLFWIEIWANCLRRLNLAAGSVCRTACHMATALLKSDFIDPPRKNTGVEAFFDDIVAQGPSFTSDAVCSWIKAALQFAERDNRLYRRQYDDRVILWFRQSWQSGFAGIAIDPGGVAGVSASAIELLCQVAGIDSIPPIAENPPLLSSLLYVRMNAEVHIERVRNYCLFASLPPVQQPDGRQKARGKSTMSRLLPGKFADRTSTILGIIQRPLQMLLSALDGTSIPKIRLAMGYSVWSILLVATLRGAGSSDSSSVVELASQLLDRAIGTLLSLKTCGIQESASALSSLIPLFEANPTVELSEDSTLFWPMLVTPNERAGVVTVLPANTNMNKEQNLSSQQRLVRVWTITSVSISSLRF